MSGSNTVKTIKHGDFTGLAADYARYRPAYAPQVATAITAYVGKPHGVIDAADVGAGTGIWTRMLADCGLRSVTAVEPNEDMRTQGIETSRGTAVQWRAGSAEVTGLADASVDLLTMASSFHWADFDRACAEFHRVLRPGGVFTALWNPRLIEVNPLLVEIEAEIGRLKPDMQRVSSGRSKFTDQLTDRLSGSRHFGQLVYMEGRHVQKQTPAQYLGVWQSVNDVQAQLGPERFGQFLQFVERRTAGLASIETTYLTRAWVVRRS